MLSFVIQTWLIKKVINYISKMFWSPVIYLSHIFADCIICNVKLWLVMNKPQRSVITPWTLSYMKPYLLIVLWSSEFNYINENSVETSRKNNTCSLNALCYWTPNLLANLEVGHSLFLKMLFSFLNVKILIMTMQKIFVAILLSSQTSSVQISI